MSLRNQPFIPLYVMDFLTDEKLRECSAESVGVYIMLMCVMHKQEQYGTISLREKDCQTGEPVADLAIKLARHLPFDRSVIERGLQELIDESVLHLEGNRLVQKRMVRDAEVSEKRTAAGKKGSQTTNAKFAAAKQAADAGESDAAKGTAKPEEEPRPKPKRTSCLSAQQQELFKKFYAVYPKKVDPATAERAWAKISPPPDEAMTEKIIQAVEAAKKYDSRFRDRQFVPNPASWLNAKGYLSEYTQDGGNGNGTYADRRGVEGFTTDPEQFKPSSGFRGGEGEK